jgi:hypothetical protein
VQVVEYCNSAVEQGTTVFRRRYALAVAIEQPHPDQILQFCDGPRNRRLRRVQERGRLVHAARLRNGHEHVQVMQPDPAFNAMARLHRGVPLIAEII